MARRLTYKRESLRAALLTVSLNAHPGITCPDGLRRMHVSGNGARFDCIKPTAMIDYTFGTALPIRFAGFDVCPSVALAAKATHGVNGKRLHRAINVLLLLTDCAIEVKCNDLSGRYLASFPYSSIVIGNSGAESMRQKSAR